MSSAPASAPPVAMPAPAVVPADARRFTAEREVDRHVGRSVGWQAAKIVVQMAQYVVLARLVLPAEYGKFALVVPVLALFTALNDGGLSTAAVTGRNYDKRLASDLYLTQLGLGAAMAAIMALGAPLLAAIYDVPDLARIGRWLALCLLVHAWSLQPRARLRRELRLGGLAMVDIAGVVAGLGAAVVAARWSTGVELLIIAQLANVGVSALFAMTLAPVRLQAFRGQVDYRHALEVGRHMVASDVLNAVRNQLPAIALGFFVVLHEVGLFNRAYQLLSLPLMVLAPALSNFLLPLLARSTDDPEQFRRHVRRTLRLFLAAAIPGCVWIAFGPAELLVLVLGEAWRPVVSLLGSLSPLFVVQLVAVVSMITMVSSERTRTVRSFSLWNLGLTAAVVLATAPFGAMAMAIGLSVSGLLLRAPLVVSFALRERTLVLADVWEALRFVLVLALAAGAAVGLSRLLPVDALVGEIVSLLAVAALSVAILVRLVRGGTRSSAL